ncbi:hypothetical protein MNBD_GAMMA20-2385 [hydrothermal vent metagenome]|uniref:Uncharacterized protein n=1 Tax=hydrothermal vent metagenome TaxID=652676 RepID=A0A3B1BI22_9ZZZZ
MTQLTMPAKLMASHRPVIALMHKKWLLAPYCRAMYFSPIFSPCAATGPGSNASKMPLAIIHNENAYNQDNEISRLDWQRLDTHGDIFRFFSR